MIQLPTDITLSNRSLYWLREWQAAIDEKTTYAAQIVEAKAKWKSKRQRTSLKEVKEKLHQMCNATNRCVYCEDSYGDEIEHIYPKDIYPSKTFIWENYLYACGPCNGPKSNNFALINPTTN